MHFFFDSLLQIFDILFCHLLRTIILLQTLYSLQSSKSSTQHCISNSSTRNWINKICRISTNKEIIAATFVTFRAVRYQTTLYRCQSFRITKSLRKFSVESHSSKTERTFFSASLSCSTCQPKPTLAEPSAKGNTHR